MARDLQNGIYQGDKTRVLSTDECAGFPESEIEDLFPAPFIAEVVDRWERRAEAEFAAVVEAGKPIVPQITA